MTFPVSHYTPMAVQGKLIQTTEAMHGMLRERMAKLDLG